MLDVLGELASELRWSSDPRLVLEVGFMRLARPHGELTLEALAERIETLELRAQDAAVMSGSETAPAAPMSGPAEAEAPVTAPDVEPEPALQQPAPSLQPEPAPQHPAPPMPHAAAIGTGPIDRARVKRAWPSVVAEIKKQRAARASAFIGTDVDVDADGVTLVVEFPREEPFRMKIADEPDTRELVKRALGVALGAAPPFRYQLGRGAVQPVQPADGKPSEPESVDVPAAPEESVEADAVAPASVAPPAPLTPDAPPTPAVPAPSSGSSDLERMLVEKLGAQIVGEQVHEAPEWKDEQ